MTRTIVLLASVALLVLVVCFAAPFAQPAAATQWEYLELAWAGHMQQPPSTSITTLQACRLRTAPDPECTSFGTADQGMSARWRHAVGTLGREGWDVVTAMKDDGGRQTWIFKRPLAAAK
jgi:hypothetical protein